MAVNNKIVVHLGSMGSFNISKFGLIVYLIVIFKGALSHFVLSERRKSNYLA